MPSLADGEFGPPPEGEAIEMSTFPDDAQQPAESTNLTGHAVLDDHHNKVGTVSDVLYDDRGEPRWAVVDPA